MDFEKNVPEWQAEGTEPPASLKESGFQAGYKPPAAFFNWFWNRVSACLTEIREKLSGHATNKENPHEVTATQIGLGKVDNTADSEKKVAFAQEAGTAQKNQNSMIVRLNGGSTEGTDQFTYDGSTSCTVNVTPEKIGAVNKAGDTMTGDLTANEFSVSGEHEYPTINFYNAAGLRTGVIQHNAIARRISFQTYGSDQDGNSKRYKTAYQLPDAEAGITEDKYHYILTSKNPVTIEQGGTGATDVRGACIKLGVEKIYYSLTNFGCTSSSTLTDVWVALPDRSAFIGQLSQFDGASWSNNDLNISTAGTLFMRKPLASSSRGDIYFIGKSASVGTYRMYLESDGMPTEVWVKELDTNSGVSKSGDTMTGHLKIAVSSGYGSVVFIDTNGNDSGVVRCIPENHKLQFGNKATDTSYEEWYTLPAPDTGMTASKSHSILTSKSPVTIGQGGTGATDAATALANLGAAKVATGSYTGTGTFGSDYLCSLTFDFEPKLLMVYGLSTNAYHNAMMILVNGFNGVRQSISNSEPAHWHQITATWGKTVKWYSTSTTMQQNESGKTYAYVAIG